jgi:hypothetical protein
VPRLLAKGAGRLPTRPASPERAGGRCPMKQRQRRGQKLLSGAGAEQLAALEVGQKISR